MVWSLSVQDKPGGLESQATSTPSNQPRKGWSRVVREVAYVSPDGGVVVLVLGESTAGLVPPATVELVDDTGRRVTFMRAPNV